MKNKGLDRREFIRLASLGLLGGYCAFNPALAMAQRMGGGGGSGGGGGGMGGGGIIDPPPGAAFKEPASMTLTRSGNVAEALLEARIAPVNVDGAVVNLMTYNGFFPGPTIRVKRGEILRLNFLNSLPFTGETNILGFQKNFTNLHTHGWHVSPKEPADAAHLEILPGQSYQYQYDTALQPGAFNFYHPHKHGLVAEQFWAGMKGALIVEDEIPVLANYKSRIMVLSDISLSGGAPAPHATMMDFMHGKEGNIIMVNGQVNPVLTAKPGEVQRWRILNASNARHYKLSLSEHNMYLVGVDGGLLDKPYRYSQILLSPGERVDILVKASNTKKSYKFLSLPYSRMGMMNSDQITLLTLSVQGSPGSQSLPAVVDPEAVRLSLDISSFPQRTLALSMGQGRGYINGQDFDVSPYTITSDLGTYEVWKVINQSNMDHPFHQHVNAAQVLALSGADSSYPPYWSLPAWKDTVMIPKGGSTTLLVPVMDYDGMTMFHCHILEHEDIGMMGMWHLMGGGM